MEVPFAPISCRTRTTAVHSSDPDSRTRRFPQWLHHRHQRPLRKTELSLSSGRPTRPRPQLSSDAENGWQDGQRKLRLTCRTAQGTTRGGEAFADRLEIGRAHV